MVIDISRAKVGLAVIVEVNGCLIPGTIMTIDHDSGELGVRKVFTDDTQRFPAAKVHVRYPCYNARQPTFSTPSLKDKNLLRLLGGYIITLSEGAFRPESLKELAKKIREKGISQKETRIQEIIEVLR